MLTTHDILGPRYIFEAVPADSPGSEPDEGEITYELYGGDWHSVFRVMGEDCCWHDHVSRLTLADVLGMAVARPERFTVGEVAGAVLSQAELFGGHKGAGMRRSLKVQLAKHGLAVES